MKTIRLTTIIALFLFFSVKGIQAQAQETKLNQAELMKQFIGTWKNIENDTTFIWECKSFGSDLEFTIKTETDGKLTIDEKSILGYDKENDRLIEAVIDPESPEIYLCPSWFTSGIPLFRFYERYGRPDNADFKWAIELQILILLLLLKSEIK
jgi:hypothetical protein